MLYVIYVEIVFKIYLVYNIDLFIFLYSYIGSYCFGLYSYCY